MSDDRFKQARRSLIDKHNQRQQQSDDDDFGDDNTQLVDLHALESKVSQAAPSFAPPPNMSSNNSFADEATALFEIPTGYSPGQSPQSGYGSEPYSSAPSYTPPASSQPANSGYGAAPTYTPPASSQPANSGYGAAPAYAPPASGGDFGADDDEGHTQFVNLNDFANEAAYFTPEQQAAGYDGNTQFVDVASLMAGSESYSAGAVGGAAMGDDIENDPILRQAYHYGPGSIQNGDVTLIFANNALGQGVILKRVWQGPAHEMSTPLRQRIAQLNALKHPNLIGMNGMLATNTGLWVELDHPGGARLTAVLQEQGPLPKETVLPWILATASVLATAHSQQLAYANLTTDALWIQPDGSVRVEPFDMLRFEERGNLGDFGPQEMHRPLEQRQLSPATDIYSLAAVAVAALTGLPLQLNRVQALDKSLQAPLTKALSNNPAERPQTAEEFAASLATKPGLDLKNLDIKKVGAVAAALLLIFGGLMYWQSEEAAKQARAQHQAQQAQLAEEEARRKLQEEQSARRAQEAAALADSAAGINRQDGANPNSDAQPAPAAANPAAQLPPVKEDPRLSITTSLKLNPPADNSQQRTKSPEKAAELRQRAKTLIEEARRMPDSRILPTYREALEAITEAILLDDENNSENTAILEDLYSKAIVKEFMSTLRNSVESEVLEGRIGSSRRNYRTLKMVDPDARALDFFENVTHAKVERVARRQTANN